MSKHGDIDTNSKHSVPPDLGGARLEIARTRTLLVPFFFAALCAPIYVAMLYWLSVTITPRGYFDLAALAALVVRCALVGDVGYFDAFRVPWAVAMTMIAWRVLSGLIVARIRPRTRTRIVGSDESQRVEELRLWPGFLTLPTGAYLLVPPYFTLVSYLSWWLTGETASGPRTPLSWSLMVGLHVLPLLAVGRDVLVQLRRPRIAVRGGRVELLRASGWVPVVAVDALRDRANIVAITLRTAEPTRGVDVALVPPGARNTPDLEALLTTLRSILAGDARPRGAQGDDQSVGVARATGESNERE